MAPKKPYVVVVGVDYSETGGLALTTAYEIAGDRSTGELHIVNVVPSYGSVVQVEIPGESHGIRALSVEGAKHFLNEYSEKRLAELGAHFGDTVEPPQRIVSHLRLNSAAEGIAQLASDLDGDLIVVGTHGRRGVRRLLVGSVAEGVVRLALCPVLVVRPKGYPDSVPQIDPPCPRCVTARETSGGKELWCEQHLQKHGRRHTYHFRNRAVGAAGNPLVVSQERQS